MDQKTEDTITYAKKYTEDLLSFFGLNTDVRASSDGEVIQLAVPSTHLNGFLIGVHAETLRSLQSIIASALRNKGFEDVRINLDIADYKKQRADRLTERAEEWIRKVKESGQEMALEPMNSADRRTVHQVASDNGLATESVGQDRDRHIVLKPAASND